MPEPQRRLKDQGIAALFLIPAAVLLLSSVSLAVISLGWPYGPDHAIMTVVGRAWRLGSPPYSAFVDVKGPAAYLPYLVSDWIGGGSMAAVRVLDLVAVCAAVVIMYRALRAVIGVRAAAWSALLLFGICYRVGYIESAQPDEWAALGTAAGFALLLHHRTHLPPWLFVVTGLVTGLAALAKPQFAVMGGVPLLVAFLWQGGAARTRSIVTLVFASLTPVVVMCAVLMAQGALGDMVTVATGPLMREYLKARAIFPTTMPELIATIQFPLLTSYGSPLFLLGALGAYEAVTRLDRRLAIALLTWFAGAFFVVAVQGRYFPYHWFPVLPPLCILAALALGRMLPEWAGAPLTPGRIPLLAAGLLALLALTASFAGRSARNVIAVVNGTRSGLPLADAVSRTVDPIGSPPRRRSNLETAAYLAAHAGSGREVGTWLYDPSPLLLARVTPNVPLFFIHPVLSKQSVVADSILQVLTAELHREAPPLFVLDCNTAWQPGTAPPERSPWLVQELRDHYDRAFTSGALMVYQRRAEPRGGVSGRTTVADSTLCGARPAASPG